MAANVPKDITERLVRPAAFAEWLQVHEDLALLHAEMLVARAEPEADDPFWVVAKHADVKEVGSRPEAFLSSGYRVLLSYLSGNGDEEVFEDPYAFSLGRPQDIDLGFGHGPNSMFGEILPRLR